MKELTQEQAERCARACDVDFSDTHYVVGNWWRKIDRQFYDPLFWFGRLWEKLLLVTDSVPVSISRIAHGPTVFIGLRKFTAEHYCLALCSAIEAPKEAGK